MSKERLDEIVDDLLNNRLELTNFVSENLEQAERVQELEDENDILRQSINDVSGTARFMLKKSEQQNKRYREALEKIARINIEQGTVTVSEVHAVLTARKALEESE